MKNKSTTFAYDIITYTNRTGHESDCFSRYPQWLLLWLKENQDKITFKPESDGIADLFLYDDVEGCKLKYKFRLGDCIINTPSGVKIGFDGLASMIIDMTGAKVATDGALNTQTEE